MIGGAGLSRHAKPVSPVNHEFARGSQFENDPRSGIFMKNKLFTIVLLLVAIPLLSACGAGQAFGPTITPTATLTSTPTITPTLTRTPTPTLTLTPTVTLTSSPSPTSACLAQNGTWQSAETSGVFGAMLTFNVNDCKVVSWQIWVFPLPGELLMSDDTNYGSLPIIDEKFSHEDSSENGVFSMTGIFDSARASHGTLDFPKGFSVFGSVLSKDVSIPWTAAPVK
jgi:hypothetical protein